MNKPLSLKIGQDQGIKFSQDLIRCWLSRNSITLLLGRPASGKSLIALDLALHLASGKDFLGFRIQSQAHVLYMSFEPNIQEFNMRLSKLTSRLPDTLTPYFHYLVIPSPNLRSFDFVRDSQVLVDELKIIEASALIVDSLDSFSSIDINNQTQVKENLDKVNALMVELNLAVMFVCHPGWRSSHIKGSSYLLENCDYQISVDIAGRRDRIISWTKIRPVGANCPGQVAINYRPDSCQLVLGSHKANQQKLLDELTAKKTWKRSELVKEIMASLDVKRRTAYTIINRCLKEDRLYETADGKITGAWRTK